VATLHANSEVHVNHLQVRSAYMTGQTGLGGETISQESEKADSDGESSSSGSSSAERATPQAASSASVVIGYATHSPVVACQTQMV